MPFYKIDNEQLISSELLEGPNFSLSEVSKDEYVYPIEGWYWFANLDEAMQGVRTAPLTPDLQTSIVQAVQDRLDAFAQTRGYDNILSACTYVASAVPKFATEGQDAVDARDVAWMTCYQILGAVLAGSRPVPTVAEVLAELPLPSWSVQ
jgi:hypothetical protein